MIAMAPNGIILAYVVTSAKRPATLTPRRLTSTTAQIEPTVSTVATSRPCSIGKTFIIAPVKASAITGKEAQIETQ